MGRYAMGAPRKSLLADTEPVDELLVPRRVLRLEVVEEAAALPDQFQEPPPRMVVLLVRLEVFREVEDPFGEQRDLHLGGAGIAIVRAEPGDDVLLLAFEMQRPCAHRFSVTLPVPPPAGREDERAKAPGVSRKGAGP